MSFTMLAVVIAVGLAGPLLALRRGWHIPIVLGELIAGVILGKTGIGYLSASDPSFTFLADIGFGLVMFVAGTHVPVRDESLRRAIRPGLLRAVVTGIVATALAFALNALFGTGHIPLYAVLMSSSSAALVLPIVDSLGLGGRSVVELLPQVAIADATCIVALPLAIDPPHAGRAAFGALAVLVAGVVVFFGLNKAEKSGVRHRVHDVSEDRRFAVELRISLMVLFALAGLAAATHVSIMLAGFVLGLAVAAVGEPRRLARQLFALTEGFLGPVFFVWLGASLDLRELGTKPAFIGLGAALGVGAVISHLSGKLTRQPLSIGALAAAQLGVPVAAATVGTSLHVLQPGEPAALILGALITIAISAVAGGFAVRRGLVATK
ncbi:Kef-type K+ transport system membrane component KefB [Kribbella aluminosa]|uniref:Kef-type K+ transport system membrane component KefB n=1 Tax=Kribbella aluminosa TaxID=416017 RepID=A0ABS4UEZ5_9ACTN|nr:cation:proton antiporter [Kribbella aluminosa]MBP2350175.1 Kef-type K+ transport system membrane component KefB [Kribbella aluminosa]